MIYGFSHSSSQIIASASCRSSIASAAVLTRDPFVLPHPKQRRHDHNPDGRERERERGMNEGNWQLKPAVGRPALRWFGFYFYNVSELTVAKNKPLHRPLLHNGLRHDLESELRLSTFSVSTQNTVHENCFKSRYLGTSLSYWRVFKNFEPSTTRYS